MLWVKEKWTMHHLSKVNLYVSIVTGNPWNIETVFEELLPLFIMEKEQGLGVLCRVLDEREELLSIGKEMYVTLFYQLVMY